MNKSTFFILFFLWACSGFGQQKIHRKCGPDIYLDTRQNIETIALNQAPFDAIVHVNIKGWGTATFVNDSTLITARHVADKKRLKEIAFYKNVFRNGTVAYDHVSLDKGEFYVLNYPEDDCHFISSDISFIILTGSGKEKIKAIYTNSIPLADHRTLGIAPTDSISLTGYPVDQEGSGLGGTDILSTKQTIYKDLLFDNKCSMVGYKLFTCSGDSGAPLWVMVNGKYYIIGIHHGGPEKTVFSKEQRNSAALITPKVIQFLISQQQNQQP